MSRKQKEIEREREIFQILIKQLMFRMSDVKLDEETKKNFDLPHGGKSECNRYFREVVKNDFVPYPEV